MKSLLIVGLLILVSTDMAHSQETKANPFALDQTSAPEAKNKAVINELKRGFDKVCSRPIENAVNAKQCKNVVEALDLHKLICETHRLAEDNRHLTDLREKMKGLVSGDLSKFGELHTLIDIYGRYNVARLILGTVGDVKSCQYLMSNEFVKDRTLMLTFLEKSKQGQ